MALYRAHDVEASRVEVGTGTEPYTTVLDANDARIHAVICNDGDCTVYLAFGQEAEVGYGIRLSPNGGSYEINLNNLFTGAITAAVEPSKAPGYLCVVETV